jgi:hypothetical protein
VDECPRPHTGLLDAEYTRRDERKVVDGECVTLDRSGETFSDAPDLSFALGGTYTFLFNNGSELAFNAAYSWQQGIERTSCTYVVNNSNEGRSSDVYGLSEVDGQLIISNPSATGDLTEPPFGSCPDGDDREQLNMRLSYFSPDRNWEVAAFVVNATDWEPKHVGDEPDGLGGELASDFSDGSPSYGRTEEPRMYGVELRYNFN